MTSPRASVRSPRSPVDGVKDLAGYLDSIKGDPAEFRSVSRPVNPMKFDVTGLLENLDRSGQYPTVQFENPLDMHGGYWTLSNRSASAICLRIRSSSSSAGPLGI